jgi:hypothetical protein
MLYRGLLATITLLAAVNLLSAQTAPNGSAPPAPPSAAESPNAPTPMEDPQTGDHWTYELRDDITGDLKSTITNTVTDVSATEINIRLAVLGNANPGYLTFRPFLERDEQRYLALYTQRRCRHSAAACRGQDLVVQRHRSQQHCRS